MSVNITHAQSISGGGITIQTQPVVRSGSGPIGLSETLAAAKTGTLTTRTDNTTGTLTMSAGHGITTGQTIDLYWTGGVRYGVTVGTVSTNSVPISSGSGDNLPAADAAITAVVQRSANIFIDGDETELLAIVLETNDKTLRSAAHIQLVDGSAAEIAEIDLVANVPRVWDLAGGDANPFTGNPITAVKISQANSTTTETYTFKIVGVQDASP